MKLISILALTLLLGATAMAQQSNTAHCVLRNPTYAGDCPQDVQYSDGDTAINACTAVLDYLNNYYSSGKDYCLNTSIRRNWTLISAQ